jgi:hypothetical protein
LLANLIQSNSNWIGSVMRIEPKPSLDTSLFYEILEEGDSVQRIKLAVRMAAFAADGEKSEGEGKRWSMVSRASRTCIPISCSPSSPTTTTSPCLSS